LIKNNLWQLQLQSMYHIKWQKPKNGLPWISEEIKKKIGKEIDNIKTINN